MSFLDGLSRPMRLAGVVLIGVALVAAVVGTTVALTGGDSGENAAPPPSSGTTGSVPPGPGNPSGEPPSSAPPSSAPPSSTAPPSSPPSSPGQPPSSQPGQPGQPQPGQPGGEQAANKWVVVRVYNNSMIHGLAEQAANDLRGQGWNVVDVSNYPSGIIPTTTAYFRPGTDEEDAARALAASFGMRAEARFPGIQASSPGLIVIVTNDYKGATGKAK
ncbi:LytR C-terminal domain-containing protein [Amycolatopsis anabasis]|uniref:LytR C-terminal domain-containing protein n=1 Tax=Amycolatopsis anabasis TaxID=1840409 RepID=UPI00131ECA86|nr:LytR C-terminal domain-containing protein [Amycolatopsis anabasis]